MSRRSLVPIALAVVAPGVLAVGCSLEEADPVRPVAPDLTAADVVSQRSLPGPDGVFSNEITMSDHGQEWTLTLNANPDDDTGLRRLASADEEIVYTETMVLSTGEISHELRSGSARWNEATGLEDWFEAANQLTGRFEAELPYGWVCTELVRLGCFAFEQWMHVTVCSGLCALALAAGPQAYAICVGSCGIAANFATTGRESIGDQCFSMATTRYCSGGGGDDGGGGGGGGGGGCENGAPCGRDFNDCGSTGFCDASNHCSCSGY